MSAYSEKGKPPETKNVSTGSAKRDIVRKHGGGGGGGGSGRKANSTGQVVDDGSTYTDAPSLNDRDPNYDSEEESGREYIPEVKNFLLERVAVGESKLTLSAFKKSIEPMMQEYFLSSEVDEFLCSVQELNCPSYSYEVVKRAINMSLDKGDKERELVSRMIAASHPEVLSTNMIAKGFERLFEIADEIEKDVPSASTMIGAFVARCVADEVLNPSFLVDPIITNLGGSIIDHAKRLLSRDHAGARLERVWGPGDGRPVDELKVAVDQILVEYLLSRDLAEAQRCIKELNAHYFHYEIVKRAIVIALEKSTEDQVAISSLFDHLAAREILSSQQLLRGFQKTYSIIDDLILDTPNALALLDEFSRRAQESKLLPAEFPSKKA